MPVYYFSTEPETVVSIVLKGCLPENLPSYMKDKTLKCFTSVQAAVASNKKPSHQNFVLEVNSDSHWYNNEVTRINPEWIKKIYIYSKTSFNLLNALFNKKAKLSVPIEIRTELYPASIQQQSTIEKRKAVENNEYSLKGKKIVSQAPYASTDNKQFYKSVKKPKLNSPLRLTLFSPMVNEHDVQITRLATPDEHFETLRSAISAAKESILITSYDIKHETLQRQNIYTLINQARQRGIKIYIYYNDSKNIATSVMNFFADNGINCDQAYTHSKFLVVDESLVTIGSFNWLSAIGGNLQDDNEGTIVCTGKALCSNLRQDIWTHIRYYRNLQYSNRKQVHKFNYNPINHAAITYSLDNNSELTYLPTLKQHRYFLQESLAHASEKIIICSPFISHGGEFLADIHHESLWDACDRGVMVFFVCSQNDPMLDDFAEFLEDAKAENAFLLPEPDFHLKTIIVDDEVITEGSFNWLSATRNKESIYHNHEATIVVDGDAAAALIEHFYHCRIGQAIREVEQKVGEHPKLGIS